MNITRNHKDRLIINPWDRFWRLVVQALAYEWNRRIAICKCDCWRISTPKLCNLNYWNSQSCWCLKKEKVKEKVSTHWLSKHKLYNVYRMILNRCNNKKAKDYKSYWWRWIKCEWETVEDFFKDMSPSYLGWLEIDRIDNNGNYCKDNCHWVTWKENCRNRRSNIFYKWKCLLDVCKERWLLYTTIQTRITYLWWSIEKAIETPIKHYNRTI